MLPQKNYFLMEIKEKLDFTRHTMTNIEKIRLQTESSLNLFEQSESEKKHKKIKINKVSKNNHLKDALKSSKNEEDLLRDTLDTIQEIRDIREEQKLEARKAGQKEPIRRGVLMKTLIESAKTIPLFVSKSPNSNLPQLCGCIPAKADYIAQDYDMVAAFIKNKKIGATWILAEVQSYDEQKKTYTVEDIDDEDKVTYNVSKNNVIPLPQRRANPATDDKALFPNGAEVLAVYPQTTCFYKGKIHSQPATCADDYLVEFEEDLVVPVFVPQRYVINIPENKLPTKKKKCSQIKVESSEYDKTFSSESN